MSDVQDAKRWRFTMLAMIDPEGPAAVLAEKLSDEPGEAPIDRPEAAQQLGQMLDRAITLYEADHGPV